MFIQVKFGGMCLVFRIIGPSNYFATPFEFDISGMDYYIILTWPFEAVLTCFS